MRASGIRRIAVIGAGLMGHGTALKFAAHGYDIRLHDREQTQRARARDSIAGRLLDIIAGERPLLKRDGNPQLDHDGNVIMVRGGTDKDVINAAKLLLSYNLGDPRTTHYEPDPDPVIDVPYASAATDMPPAGEDEPQTLAELRAGVSALIEATVQSVNTRPSRSRKRV
jgi:hypothetical protein